MFTHDGADAKAKFLRARSDVLESARDYIVEARFLLEALDDPKFWEMIEGLAAMEMQIMGKDSKVTPYTDEELDSGNWRMCSMSAARAKAA